MLFIFSLESQDVWPFCIHSIAPPLLQAEQIYLSVPEDMIYFNATNSGLGLHDFLHLNGKQLKQHQSTSQLVG